MEDKKILFWEESYKNEGISAFGVNPNPEVKDYVELFNKNGKVLEAGCGEAKNAFFLIENGFNDVSAFDLSENAIKKVHKIAESKRANINAFIQDLCMFQWEYKYDLVISYGTLHFVKNDGWHKFLTDAKEHTNYGGFHVIQIWGCGQKPGPRLRQAGTLKPENFYHQSYGLIFGVNRHNYSLGNE